MLATIVNNFSYPVIAIDKRDPKVSWANHKARGSLGGVDLAYPYGASVKAPASGRYTYTKGTGSGGNIGTIHLSDGRRIELLHLSATVAANNSTVRLGQVIAKSGGSGFGEQHHYADHLHTHLVLANGTRVNLFEYFTYVKPVIKPAIVVKPVVIPVPPTATKEEEETMGFYIKDPKDSAVYWFSQSTGTKRHITAAEWHAVNAAETLKLITLSVVPVNKADLAAIPTK